MPHRPPNPKPVQRSGDGPGRWNYESGASPNITVVPIRRRLRPTAS
ncbi:hypothetical protein ACFC0K_29120 [Streptomyces hydrogenans]